jgi:hypothetical protein
VKIYILEDFGIPNGAVLSESFCPREAEGYPIGYTDVHTQDTTQDEHLDRCNPAYRYLKWSPQPGSEGQTYKVCATAKDDKDYCSPGGWWTGPSGGSANNAALMNKGTNAPNDVTLSSPLNGLSQQSTFHLEKFVESSRRLKEDDYNNLEPAVSDRRASVSDYQTHSASEAYFSGSDWMKDVSSMECVSISVPAPKCRWDFESGAGNGVATNGDGYPSNGDIIHARVGCEVKLGWRIECDNYPPVMNLPDTIDGKFCSCPIMDDSHCVSQEGDGSIESPHMYCHLPMGIPVGDPNRGGQTENIFVWTPERGQEGSSHNLCISGGDTFGIVTLEEICVDVVVGKCQYCVARGDTLTYITKHFQIDTNWRRLWSLNSWNENDSSLRTIHNPDTMTSDNRRAVRVGIDYEVQAGDTLANVASHFGTTVKKLLDVNADYSLTSTEGRTRDGNHLQVGDTLCIVPCTDTVRGGRTGDAQWAW